ncbi:putative beta-1,3-galactosyltransferase 14 [Hordeum vulgare]|nr:putative beta-1,3-galactosyltransferase 14 [Hordeum vulgare]
MPSSPKVFSSSTAATSRRSSLRRLLSSPAVSASCLLFDLAAAVSVAWDQRPGNAAGGATELPVGHATGSRGRHKVMAFVGIFTGFGSVVRRRALRRTWLPSDRQGLLRLVGGGAARRSRPATARLSGPRQRWRHGWVVS